MTDPPSDKAVQELLRQKDEELKTIDDKLKKLGHRPKTSRKRKPPPYSQRNPKDRKDTFIRFRITTERFNAVAARAKEAGYSLGAYARKLIDTEDDGFRARRRPISDNENIMTLLGELGSIRALHNQMAKQANMRGFDPASFEEAQQAALEYREFMYRQMGRDAPPSRVRRTRSGSGRKEKPGP